MMYPPIDQEGYFYKGMTSTSIAENPGKECELAHIFLCWTGNLWEQNVTLVVHPQGGKSPGLACRKGPRSTPRLSRPY